jgi:hypothetical protein
MILIAILVYIERLKVERKYTKNKQKFLQFNKSRKRLRYLEVKNQLHRSCTK